MRELVLSPESVRAVDVQELLGGGRTTLAASGCPVPALEAPGGQAQFNLRY